MTKTPEKNLADEVANLCARRGIIFPDSEIYGGMAGFFDYGPVGVELKREFEHAWWNYFVRSREDVVGLDGSIITHPLVWKASGHVDSFTDPLVDCKKCKMRFRADHLIEEELKLSVDGISPAKLNEMVKHHKLVCPKCKGELTDVRVFNLMFNTHVGPVSDDEHIAYLRPETAQSIFAAFKQVLATSRKQLPFGIAQIGKAFRNEISPRNFVFRCREFSQAEIEFFLNPDGLNDCHLLTKKQLDLHASFYTQECQEKKKPPVKSTIGEMLEKKIIGTKWHAYWLAECMRFFTQVLQIDSSRLRFRQHLKDELSHYSSETWDIEYSIPGGATIEVMGIANRSDFDLTQHAKVSGKDLTFFDQEGKKKVTPFVIEPSLGIDRSLFTLMIDKFEQVKEKDEVKNVLRLPVALAPVKVAVFPLMKKDGLAEKGFEVFEQLREQLGVNVEYDESGSIGKRYARQDEVGTPYCVTIDYDTLQDNTVTVRERDSTKQERVPIAKLASYFKLH